MTDIGKRLAWLAPILVLTGCEAVVLSPSGDIAARQAELLVQSTLLMLIIIVPVMDSPSGSPGAIGPTTARPAIAPTGTIRPSWNW